MDPSVAEVRRQGNKASESTTDGVGGKFRSRAESGRAVFSSRLTPGQARAQHAVPLQGNCGAHPGGWAAHLYCIGDETLTRKLGGESGAAIARMNRFGVRQE